MALLALSGVAALALYASSLAPETVAIGDLDESRVGTRVQVVGLVQGVRLTTGGLLLTIHDPLDGTEVAVFVPRGVYEEGTWEGVVEGAEVLVSGEVQLYDGRLEIRLTSGGDLRVLQPPRT